MNTQNWLSLMEYSAKYRVSLSTLRRRIKSGEIEYKFIEGKYLLKNSPLLTGQAGSETIAPPTQALSRPQPPASIELPAAPIHKPAPAAPPVDVQALLTEIKKAYALILQEKETQIVQLKNEVADLRTLVRVLEDENTRLKRQPTGLVDFDLGLEA